MLILCLRCIFYLATFSFAASVSAALPPWTLEVERLSLGNSHLNGVRLTSTQSAVAVRVQAITVENGTAAYGPLTATCPGDIFVVGESLCSSGTWSLHVLQGWPELRGTLSSVTYSNGQLFAETHGSLDAMRWSAQLTTSDDNLRLTLDAPKQDFAALAFLGNRVPAISWLSAGRISGSATLLQTGDGPVEASGAVRIEQAEFDSPDGLYAGLGVTARLDARLKPATHGAVAVQAALTNGELLLKDFYRNFSERALEADAQVQLTEAMVDVSRVSIGDGDALHLAGQVQIPLGDDAGPPQVLLREFRLQFPEVYRRYLEPIAAVWQLDGLETAGAVSWSGDWSPGDARSGVLEIDAFSASDSQRGRFAIRGLEGELRTGVASQLGWDALAFEKLNLGAGTARIELAEEAMRLIEPLRIDVFGGNLSLESLSVHFPRGGEPDVQVRAGINDIAMQQMSTALGWPEFSGTLSGRIPGVTYAGGVLGIEGALEFQVFNGEVVLTDLSVERPFGVLPSLAANLTATNLDLEELTRTFEFGRIAGRIDGYVHDLRMLDWNPVQFDAWFGTPAGAGRNDISRQAVSHLTTIGGGSATAMLSGPVLRLFNNFSYRRLGIGCLLQDNVCQIRGIEEQGKAVLLLEGAGIPKISIQAYNRAVDWPQLLAQLVAISSGEEVRIGD